MGEENTDLGMGRACSGRGTMIGDNEDVQY